MPFKSKAQMRFMYAKHPVIAERWSKEKHPSYKNLPEHKKNVTKNAKKSSSKKA